MALLMNDTDMKQMLESIRPEGETYQEKHGGRLCQELWRCWHWEH